MPATIIEELETHEEETHNLPEDPNAATQEEIVAAFEGQPTEGLEAQSEPDIPDKYRDKSIQDIIGMHQEAEKLIGKHSSEVGELRKTVDQFILGKLNEDNQQQQPEPEPVDFFEDPEKAVQQAIETHPAVQQANQQALQFQQQNALAQLQQRHPDFKQVLEDPKFGDWVKASPVRTELFQRADKNYDATVADELLTLYKERAGVAQQQVQAEQQARKQQVKAASTGSQGAGAGGGGKRIYRRADIIKLMKTDPDRYEQLSPELMQAYSEGRVR